ncbi:amino acid permease [Chryseobacterium jejuense]|uniref:amino acid permease n=1 Tax=Chryseobacterium jejuense TaxID=445960 RepID=UPI001AE40C4B|nr:amino acid permease [Chryseobacterium jejuense]MBP2616212.1 APA family basic amino acid/polyamine antiporter [Chryseobacterium jejuense]
MSKIWVKKPLSAYEADMKKSELKKVLGKWSLTAIGVGAIIGGGIFVLTGTGAYYHAGPALAISFIIAGIACVFAALCYAEFASIIPVEGSAYAYAYGTVGEIFAWAMGWCLILEYAMASMAVSVSWSGYFTKFLKIFGVHLPAYLTSDPASYTGEGFSMNLPAFILVLLITALLVKGTKEAAGANNLIVLMKTSAVVFVIIAGVYIIFSNTDLYNAVDGVKNWKPFIPDQIKLKNSEGDMVSAYGIKGIISGAAAIFFAYIGFDAVSTQAGEAINPKKDVPFAIITSLLVCTALYICVSLVLTGMMHYTDFNPEGKYPDAIKAPVAYAFEIAGKHWASNVVTIAATVGLISVVMVMMMGQSRIFIGMAKDGLIPQFFGELHPKTKTPYKGIILLGVVVAFIAAFTPISTLADMTSFGTLFAFTLVCIAVWVMRKKEPELIRPFKVPAYKLIVTLGVVINIYLIFNLSAHALELSAVWLFLGGLVYFLYGKSNSKLNNPEKYKDVD